MGFWDKIGKFIGKPKIQKPSVDSPDIKKEKEKYRKQMFGILAGNSVKNPKIMKNIFERLDNAGSIKEMGNLFQAFAAGVDIGMSGGVKSGIKLLKEVIFEKLRPSKEEMELKPLIMKVLSPSELSKIPVNKSLNDVINEKYENVYNQYYKKLKEINAKIRKASGNKLKIQQNFLLTPEQFELTSAKYKGELFEKLLEFRGEITGTSNVKKFVLSKTRKNDEEWDRSPDEEEEEEDELEVKNEYSDIVASDDLDTNRWVLEQFNIKQKDLDEFSKSLEGDNKHELRAAVELGYVLDATAIQGNGRYSGIDHKKQLFEANKAYSAKRKEVVEQNKKINQENRATKRAFKERQRKNTKRRSVLSSFAKPTSWKAATKRVASKTTKTIIKQRKKRRK